MIYHNMTAAKKRCFRHCRRPDRRSGEDADDEDGHWHCHHHPQAINLATSSSQKSFMRVLLVLVLVMMVTWVPIGSAMTDRRLAHAKVAHHHRVLNKNWAPQQQQRAGTYKMAGKVVQLRFGHCGVKIEDFQDETGARQATINNYTVQVERQALVRRLTEEFGLDVWTADMETVTFLVAPRAWKQLEDALVRQNIDYRILKHDVREAVNSTSPRAGWRPRRLKRQIGLSSNDTEYDETLPKFNFNDFHDSTTINNQLKFWAEEHPAIMRIDLRAVTPYEKGKIYRVRLGEFRYRRKRKPAIFIEAANHAREWISPMAAMHFIDHIIRTYYGESGGTNNEESLLEHFDFHVIPVSNPDGYDFSLEHQENRLWRKNMNPNKVPENIDACAGVDLNRNYDSHWGQLGSSPEFCSEAYRGARAGSEVETQVVQELLLNARHGMRGRFRMAVSIHCCAGMVLTPYGFKMELPSNYKDLENYGLAFAQGARRTDRRFDFRVGPSSLTLYPASGMLSDFARQKAEIPLSYAIELPNTGPDLFLTPPGDIKKIGESFVSGMREMLFELARNLPKDPDGKDRVRYA